MQAIFPSDCPKLCGVRLEADHDGTITASISHDAIAADGNRYTLWSEDAANCSGFPNICEALVRTGWRLDHVANIRFTREQLWQLIPVDEPAGGGA